MKIKAVIMNKAVPILARQGFSFYNPGKNHYLFVKHDGIQKVSITTEKYNPSRIRVTYIMNCEHPFTLELANLKAEFCPISAMTYSTQEEFEAYVEEVMKETIDIIFPFLYLMKDNRVFSSNELSQELAHGITEHVNRACSKWSLSQIPSRENIKMIDMIMNGMRTDTYHRKEDFFKNINDIIDLAAYFGELIAQSKGAPGRWIWREVCPGNPRFVIEVNGYDPLERLISAWNFGPESIVHSIERFPLPKSTKNMSPI